MILLMLALLAAQFSVPDLELRTLEGKAQRLSEYRDRIVVLNFWATWCVPCEKEMLLFVELQAQYGARGIQFIGVSTDDKQTRRDVPGFVRKHRINFPVWVDAAPEHQASFRLATLLPSTIVLDREMRPVFRIIGETKSEDLVSRLIWLLSDRATPALAELVLPAGITPEHFKEHELGLEDEHEEEEAGSVVPS